MKLRILTVGKRNDPWVNDGVETYSKRLRAPFLPEVEIIPNSTKQGLEARQEESRRLLSRVDVDDFVILLDEKGKNISSPELSSLITDNLTRNIIIIIGGAYGVDETLEKRADFIWSLSKLVFPHQIVRLILTEQLYRAQEIHRGGSYHHL